jgi:hypothetical protein
MIIPRLSHGEGFGGGSRLRRLPTAASRLRARRAVSGRSRANPERPAFANTRNVILSPLSFSAISCAMTGGPWQQLVSSHLRPLLWNVQLRQQTGKSRIGTERVKLGIER